MRRVNPSAYPEENLNLSESEPEKISIKCRRNLRVFHSKKKIKIKENLILTLQDLEREFQKIVSKRQPLNKKEKKNIRKKLKKKMKKHKKKVFW